MSNDDFGNAPPPFDPDETVEHEAMHMEFAEAEAESLVDEGSPGRGAPDVAKTLDGTGLERAARRVLARRGIDVTDVQALSTLESLHSPEGESPLRDILEAASPVAVAPGAPGGGPGGPPVLARMRMESIIPDADGDGRERLFETKVYPYSAIAALEITAADGARYVGTAWFVSPRTLITAGHCVFVHSPGAAAHGWVRSIRVIPGKNGPGTQGEPFGSVVATRFRSVAGWVKNGDPGSDYAAILLPDDSPVTGETVGMFGIGAFSDAKLRPLNLNVAGYPGDKTGNERQTLWFDVKNPARLSPRQVFYDVDTYGGQSGAPVYVADGDKRIAVAIHAYGTSATVTSNSGTRINADVFKRIQSWKT